MEKLQRREFASRQFGDRKAERTKPKELSLEEIYNSKLSHGEMEERNDISVPNVLLETVKIFPQSLQVQ